MQMSPDASNPPTHPPSAPSAPRPTTARTSSSTPQEAPPAPDHAFYQWDAAGPAGGLPPWHYPGAGPYSSAQSPPPLPADQPPATDAAAQVEHPPPPPPPPLLPAGPRPAPLPAVPETWTEEDEQAAVQAMRQHLESLAAATGLAASCTANYQPLLFKLWDANLQVCNALHDEEDMDSLPPHLLAAATAAAAAPAAGVGPAVAQEEAQQWQQPTYQVWLGGEGSSGMCCQLMHPSAVLLLARVVKDM